MSKKAITLTNDQKVLLEVLRKVPIVQAACGKVGVGRATYYRWRKDRPDFAKLAEEAIKEGVKMVNDVAESKLLTKIEEGNMTGIIFWLKNHHAGYEEKLTVKAQTQTKPLPKLTDQQKAVVQQLLDKKPYGKK